MHSSVISARSGLPRLSLTRQFKLARHALDRPARSLCTRIVARKYTRRATDQIPDPGDPFSKQRAYRDGNGRRNTDTGRRNKEPFDAELLVLFGLPAIIIIIPWAIKDPAALAIIPLVLLIPGPRDVLLTVVRDVFTGMRKAKQFVRNNNRNDTYTEDTYTDDDGPRSSTNYRRSSRWEEEEEEQPTAFKGRPTINVIDLDDATIISDVSPEPGSKTGKSPRSSSSRTIRRVSSTYWDSDDDDNFESPSSFSTRYGTNTESNDNNNDDDWVVKKTGRARPASGVAGRGLVRKGRQGRIGVDVRQQRDVPWYLVPLVTLFPFLRYWGGFM